MRSYHFEMVLSCLQINPEFGSNEYNFLYRYLGHNQSDGDLSHLSHDAKDLSVNNMTVDASSYNQVERKVCVTNNVCYHKCPHRPKYDIRRCHHLSFLSQLSILMMRRSERKERREGFIL